MHNRSRLVTTIAAISVAFFLASAQIGLLVGWINTNTAIIRHAGVDLWVMARKTPAFDYGTAIPRHRIQQVKSIPGIAWAEGLFMAWNIWQHPNGKRVNVELIGIDKSLVGGPWKLLDGRLAAVHVPKTVIVDELYLNVLGVNRVGEDFEMIGERARVGGISQGIRTFTASPFVFTSIESAIKYDKRYRDDEITYVLARCNPDQTPSVVRDRIAAAIPQVEALTTQDFALRSSQYWMLETGVGITVVITAILGLAVGSVIMSQTLFAITQDHLPNYATLLALGFHQSKLHLIVILQSMMLGGSGIMFGAMLFAAAALASARTPIPLETTPMVSMGLVTFSLLTCIGASWLSIRAIFGLDPVVVFQG